RHGIKGFPVIDAKIPHVSLTTSSLSSIHRTGTLSIKQLLLSQPDITLYLDKEDAEKVEEDEEQIAQMIVETLNIADFQIIGGLLTLREKEQAREIYSFNNLGITLSDLDFNLSSRGSFDRRFYLN